MGAKEAWITAHHFKTFDADAKKERKSRIQVSDEVLVSRVAFVCSSLSGMIAPPSGCLGQGVFETRDSSNEKTRVAVKDRASVDIMQALARCTMTTFAEHVLKPDSTSRAAILSRLEVELRNEVVHSFQEMCTADRSLCPRDVRNKPPSYVYVFKNLICCCQSRAFYERRDSMLRWKMSDLFDWSWEPLRVEFETHLPLRWRLLQHMAANPRDINLTFAPRTKAYGSVLGYACL